MEKKFIIRRITVGRESLYMYNGEYGYTFGYGIHNPLEIVSFNTKEEAETVISQLDKGMLYEIVEVYRQ